MALSRRWLFALLPAALLGACLLPTHDEFAAVLAGQPLSIETIVARDGGIFASNPVAYHRERAFGFGADGPIVERRIRSELLASARWKPTMRIDFRPPAELKDVMSPRQAWGYTDQDSADELDLIRYERPVEGMRLAVIVREKDDAWGRLRRRLLRIVGR